MTSGIGGGVQITVSRVAKFRHIPFMFGSGNASKAEKENRPIATSFCLIDSLHAVLIGLSDGHILYYPMKSFLNGKLNDQKQSEILIYPGTASVHRKELQNVGDGHLGEITCIHWHPDICGGVLLSASVDRTIKIWNIGELKSVTCLQTLHGHGATVTGIGILPYSFTSISSDGTMIFWCQDPVRRFVISPCMVPIQRFSCDGSAEALPGWLPRSCSSSPTIGKADIWFQTVSIVEGETSVHVVCSTSIGSILIFTPQGLFPTTSPDKVTISALSSVSMKKAFVSSLGAPPVPVLLVPSWKFSSSNDEAATVCAAGSTGTPLICLASFDGSAKLISVLPPENYNFPLFQSAASVKQSCNVQPPNYPTRTFVRDNNPFDGYYSASIYDEKHGEFLIGDTLGCVSWFSVQEEEIVETRHLFSGSQCPPGSDPLAPNDRGTRTTDVTVSKKAGVKTVAGSQGFKKGSTRIMQLKISENEKIRGIALSKNSSELYVLTNQGVDVFSLTRGRPIPSLEGHSAPIVAAFLKSSITGPSFVSVGSDCLMNAWDLDTHVATKSIHVKNIPELTCSTLLPLTGLIATGHVGGSVRLWNLEEAVTVPLLPPESFGGDSHFDNVSSIVAALDLNRAIRSCGDWSILQLTKTMNAPEGYIVNAEELLRRDRRQKLQQRQRQKQQQQQDQENNVNQSVINENSKSNTVSQSNSPNVATSVSKFNNFDAVSLRGTSMVHDSILPLSMNSDVNKPTQSSDRIAHEARLNKAYEHQQSMLLAALMGDSSHLNSFDSKMAVGVVPQEFSMSSSSTLLNNNTDRAVVEDSVRYEHDLNVNKKGYYEVDTSNEEGLASESKKLSPRSPLLPMGISSPNAFFEIENNFNDPKLSSHSRSNVDSGKATILKANSSNIKNNWVFSQQNNNNVPSNNQKNSFLPSIVLPKQQNLMIAQYLQVRASDEQAIGMNGKRRFENLNLISLSKTLKAIGKGFSGPSTAASVFNHGVEGMSDLKTRVLTLGGKNFARSLIEVGDKMLMAQHQQMQVNNDKKLKNSSENGANQSGILTLNPRRDSILSKKLSLFAPEPSIISDSNPNIRNLMSMNKAELDAYLVSQNGFNGTLNNSLHKSRTSVLKPNNQPHEQSHSINQQQHHNNSNNKEIPNIPAAVLDFVVANTLQKDAQSDSYTESNLISPKDSVLSRLKNKHVVMVDGIGHMIDPKVIQSTLSARNATASSANGNETNDLSNQVVKELRNFNVEPPSEGYLPTGLGLEEMSETEGKQKTNANYSSSLFNIVLHGAPPPPYEVYSSDDQQRKLKEKKVKEGSSRQIKSKKKHDTEQLASMLSGFQSEGELVALRGRADVVITGGYDCRICVWRVSVEGTKAMGKLMVVGLCHPSVDDEVTALLYLDSPGGTWVRDPFTGIFKEIEAVDENDAYPPVILSGGNAGVIYMWSLGGLALLGAFRAHDDGVTCISRSLDNRFIITGGADNKIRVWNRRAIFKKLLGPAHLLPRAGHSLAHSTLQSPSGGGVKYKNKNNDKTPLLPISIIDAHSEPPSSVACLPPPLERFAVSCARDGNVVFFDVETGNVRHIVRPGSQFMTKKNLNGARSLDQLTKVSITCAEHLVWVCTGSGAMLAVDIPNLYVDAEDTQEDILTQRRALIDAGEDVGRGWQNADDLDDIGDEDEDLADE